MNDVAKEINQRQKELNNSFAFLVYVDDQQKNAFLFFFFLYQQILFISAGTHVSEIDIHNNACLGKSIS